MRVLAGSAAALCLLAAEPAVARDWQSARYACERGVEIPVVYVNGVEPAIAILSVEGALITLEVERSGSGARYGWPSDGSHYVWWSEGDTAQLLWRDGATGEETVIYSDCKEMQG
jgi:membrane-bound inhibitor of C-type lysozyme